MSTAKEAVVLLAKCPEFHKIYGIRTELLTPNRWQLTWAFPIKETSARREGYDQTSINGSLEFSSEYPGCPYCHSHQITVCSCGRVSCTVLKNDRAVCGWCGRRGELGEYTTGAIKASIDR